jgi:hypothetical protein
MGFNSAFKGLKASFEVKGPSLPRKELTVHNKLGIGCAAQIVWMLWKRESL